MTQLAIQSGNVFAHLQEVLSSEIERKPIVYLRDVSFAELKCLIQFIYTGKTDVASLHLTSFMTLANSLGVKGFGEQSKVDDDSSKKNKTPTKRKMEDKENVMPTVASPLKHSNSEPLALCSGARDTLAQKKRRPTHPRSLDQSPSQSLLRPPKNSDEYVFKEPLPPRRPVLFPSASHAGHVGHASHAAAASCPAGDLEGQGAAKSIHHQQEHSVDSSLALLDPDVLAAKGATLLHYLALWMQEERRTGKKEAAPPVAVRHMSECDRPDSGFDSKDESASACALGASPKEEDGDTSSPETAEISRQAAIRHPIRKKRLHNIP
jgi:hypothetical protein